MFVEDLTAFFDTVNGFAETVQYQSKDVAAIFDAAFHADMLGSVGVESTKPACLVRSADVLNVAHEHVVKRGTTTYRVVGVHPDGTGVTLLVLEKQ